MKRTPTTLDQDIDLGLENIEIVEPPVYLQRYASRPQVVNAKIDAITAVHEIISKGGYKIKEIKPKDSNKASILVNLSDTHFGKIVHSQFDTKVTFNRTIAVKRINAIFETVYSLVDKNVDEIIINLIGDLVEGDGGIYKTQTAEIRQAVMDQVKDFIDALYPHILTCSKKVDSVRIYCIPGNHGELRGRFGINPHQNWDTTVAMMMQMIIGTSQKSGSCKNVYLKYIESKEGAAQKALRYKVKGYTVHLEHILPPNLSTTASRDKIQNIMYNKRGEVPDFIFTGHYHSEAIDCLRDTHIIRVGSLVGFDQFASDNKLPANDASQSILVVDKQNKIKLYQPLLLGHIT